MNHHHQVHRTASERYRTEVMSTDAVIPALPKTDPVLIFDGDCAMCSRSVQLVLKLDRAARFRFLPVRTPLGETTYRDLGLDPQTPDTAVLLVNGNAYVKSDAILRAAIHLGFPWAIARVALLIPERWRDAIYDVVARNRKRFQRSDRCYLPKPGERERFLA